MPKIMDQLGLPYVVHNSEFPFVTLADKSYVYANYSKLNIAESLHPVRMRQDELKAAKAAGRNKTREFHET